MNKKTILVIDDEHITIQIISELLNDKYNLKIAKNGIDGFAIYKKYRPSIIISDIDMPNMDGIELATKIREIDHNTKIIFVTSHSSVEYILKSTSLKLTKYIFKPIDKDELLNAIKEAQNELESFRIICNNVFQINDDYKWDFKNLTLLYQNSEISLTPNEKKILNFLLQEMGNTKTYDEIIQNISNGFNITTKESLKTIITNLRKKIEIDLIINVYAQGYKISI